MTDIREAHEGDLDALLELYLDLHEQSIPEHDGRLRDTWVRILADPDHHLIVCEHDGDIVSSCVCVIIPNLTRGVRPYAFVENVVTRADARGRSYATACLNHAKALAQQHRQDRVHPVAVVRGLVTVSHLPPSISVWHRSTAR